MAKRGPKKAQPRLKPGLVERPTLVAFLASTWFFIFYAYCRDVRENLADETYEWVEDDREAQGWILTRLYEAARDGLPATEDAAVTAAREDLDETLDWLGLSPSV